MVETRTRRRFLAIVVLFGCGLLTACQVHTTVDVEVNHDGSGSLTVGVGFDEAALDELGDPGDALYLDDLEAAGWEIEGPEVDEDGITWLWGSRSFGSIEELALVLAEVSGAEGPLRDPELDVQDGDEETTYRFTATVDLSEGLEAFGDPELAEELPGEFGGIVDAVEEQEGRPVEEMFDISLTWSLAGEEQVLTPSLGDPATSVELVSVVEKPDATSVWPVVGVAGVGAVLGLGLVARSRGAR